VSITVEELANLMTFTSLMILTRCEFKGVAHGLTIILIGFLVETIFPWRIRLTTVQFRIGKIDYYLNQLGFFL